MSEQVRSKRDCPLCGTDSRKVIYMGFPVLLCRNEECNCVFGFWGWVMNWVPFNGYFMTYTGSYVSALWYWLVVGPGNEE